MKLITKTIEKEIGEHPLYSTEQNENPMDNEIIVKFFNPFTNCTWIATEGEKQPNGDILFFGFVKMQFEEWGYFSLSELQNIFGIERDKYSSTTVGEELKHMGIQ